eukprot:TRINITY_DN48286_c0_g1_i1.p1 TRINITY_DN48286_c0_g1~~TRINITY_DN48286_c0_g1_i1.p1  ORF type:complete len:600 (+),score=79.75 TRINITY_DN48286_c0_g1_i1:129-1802(+)
MVCWGTYKYRAWVSDSNTAGRYILQSFRFLFFRFTPQRYYYGLILIVRSLLICLVPVVIRSDTAMQMSVMAGIISFFVIVQQQLNPWHSTFSNIIDGAMSVTMNVLLVVGALATDVTAHMDSIKVMGSMVFFSACAVVFGSLLFSLYRRCVPRPYYDKFICHHKAGSGAQARLLKIMIQAKTDQSVFIDSDDLKELDQLFDIVKCKVGHLVVYLTRETLSRPWCAGEIVTAFRVGIKVTAVKTPSFMPPTDEHFAELESYLDLSSTKLTPYGITLPDVAHAFKQLLGEKTPSVEFRANCHGSRRSEAMVCDIIGMPTRVVTGLPAVPTELGMTVILADTLNDEAVASASILASKIQQDVFRISREGVCCLCDHRQDLHDMHAAIANARAVIVILSSSCMQSYPMTSSIIELMNVVGNLGDAGPVALPVTIPGFQFPDGPFFEDTLEKLLQLGTLTQSLSEAISHIKQFFKRIAVTFTTNGSDQLLDTQADAIFLRVRDSGWKQQVTSQISMRSAVDAVSGSVKLMNSLLGKPKNSCSQPPQSEEVGPKRPVRGRSHL